MAPKAVSRRPSAVVVAKRPAAALPKRASGDVEPVAKRPAVANALMKAASKNLSAKVSGFNRAVAQVDVGGGDPPLKPSEGVPSTELKFQQDKATHIVGNTEQVEGKYFAKVNGRPFDIPP